MSQKYGLNTKISLKSVVQMLNRPWPSLKDRLLSGVDKVCGKTKGGPVPHNETWWWNDAVNDIVKEKQKN